MSYRDKAGCARCKAEPRPDADQYSSCWHSIEDYFGFEEVASFDDPDASYSFDQFIIWRRKSDGALFYGQDSGCSCPSPFEEFDTVDSFTPITPNSWETFTRDFAAYASRRSGYRDDGARWIEAHVEGETVDKVRALLYQAVETR